MEHDMNTQEFMDLMEVQINKAEDKLSKQALYDLGVKRMAEASNKESQ
jgi:hypothetical protein